MSKFWDQVDEAKTKAKEVAEEAKFRAKKFYFEHEQQIKDWAIPLTIGATFLAKTGIREAHRAEERHHRDCEHYDRKADEWYESKRKLSNKEKLRMEKLVSEGYSKGEALKKMGLLKK